MIVNIRGTSGSGKTTAVKQGLLEQFRPDQRFKWVPKWDQIPEEHRPERLKRKQPWGYHLIPDRPGKSIVVIGHYETACGGTDTISKMDTIFSMVRQAHLKSGCHVVFEGLLLSADFNRTYALHQDGLPLVVLGMDVPLDVCLDSVNARRWAKNPDKPPVNPKNTESKYKGTKNTMKKLQDHGVDARWVDREGCKQALAALLEL